MLAWLCLGQGADMHMAQLMQLPLTISCSSKSRLVLPFWCWLTQIVRDKIKEVCKPIVCVCSVMEYSLKTAIYQDITHRDRPAV